MESMPERSPSLDLVRLAKLGAREIVVDHVPWYVYELPALAFDRRSTPSLVFESEGSMRRVRDYPSNWRSLTDEILYALSWSI